MQAMNLEKNYYQRLDVETNATLAEIRDAYKRKVLSVHPDKNKNISSAAFIAIHEAFTTLSDEAERMKYDKKLNIERVNHKKSNFNRKMEGEEVLDEVFSPVVKLGQELTDFIVKNEVSPNFEKFLDPSLNLEVRKIILNSILYHACLLGSFNTVTYLIENQKMNPQVKVFKDGMSFSGGLLKAAAKGGHLGLVKYLYETHHVDIECQGLCPGLRSSALSEAARHGHEEIVDYLISKGANRNPEVAFSNLIEEGIRSKKLSIVTRLVDAGVKIETFTLSRAIKLGLLDVVQYLFEKKPGLQNHLYSVGSPGLLAVQSGNLELVKYLEETQQLDIFVMRGPYDNATSLLLEAAAYSKSIEMTRYLLDKEKLDKEMLANERLKEKILIKAFDHPNPFEKCSVDQHLEFVRFIFEEMKVCLPGEKLHKIIINEAKFCNAPLASYLLSYLYHDSHVKSELIEISKKKPSEICFGDLLKLYNLCKIKNNKYYIRTMIENLGITIEQLEEEIRKDPTIRNEALLYYSNYRFKDDISRLQRLLKLGADINYRNAKGLTGIHVALDGGVYGKRVQFYVDHNADLEQKNRKGKTAKEIIEKMKSESD